MSTKNTVKEKASNIATSVKDEINSWPTRFKELSFIQKVIVIVTAIYIYLTVKEDNITFNDLFKLDTWKSAVNKLFTIKNGIILTVVYFLFFAKSSKDVADEKSDK